MEEAEKLKEEEWKWSPSSFPIEGHEITLMTRTVTDEAAKRTRYQGLSVLFESTEMGSQHIQNSDFGRKQDKGEVSKIFSHYAVLS